MGVEEIRYESSWWTARNVVFGVLGLASALVTIAALWSEEAQTWYSNHGVVGWIALAVTVLTASVVIVVLKHRHAAALASVRRKHERDLLDVEVSSPARVKVQLDLRVRQCSADVAVIEHRLGRFMSDGDIRNVLEQLPSGKLFSRELFRAFEQLERDLDDQSRNIFDEQLSTLLNQMKGAFSAYWEPVAEHLDAPGEIQSNRWNMQIIQPPGGDWNGDTRSQHWEAFYKFVRSLASRLNVFLQHVEAIEAHVHQLRVEVGLAPKI